MLAEDNLVIEKLKLVTEIQIDNFYRAAKYGLFKDDAFNSGICEELISDKQLFEAYFKGVSLIPERKMLVAKNDETILGGILLILANKFNQNKAFTGKIQSHFVVEDSNSTIAAKLLENLETYSKKLGLTQLIIEVNKNNNKALKLYYDSGFDCYGNLKKFELDNGRYAPGKFLYKEIC